MKKLITISRELVKKDDLVLIPRVEYEEYLRLKKVISIVKPTKSEERAIYKGRKEIRTGKYLTAGGRTRTATATSSQTYP
jgi:hypothetical protein